MDLTKNVVFVLTYNEEDLWVKNYPVEEFHDTYKKFQFIILDNGNQPKMEQWCNDTGSYYYASEFNIGSSGGYNWIYKVANLLELDRAVLTQGDVELTGTEALDTLFNNWTDEQIPFYPQVSKEFWDDAGSGMVYNLGQLYSFNPTFILKNNFTIDENYVVTHFDDADVMRRMSEWGVDLINVLHRDYPHLDCIQEPWPDTTHIVDGLYTVHHWSSAKNEGSTNHQNWLDYNYGYHQTKWGGEGMPNQYPHSDITWDKVKQQDKTIYGDKLNELQKFNINAMLPHSERWTRLGYYPYPVEHEINRFWKQYLTMLGISMQDK